MALLTIVVPTFNRSDYLDKALTSISDQTFTDYEVVVADDAGSADLSTVKAKWDDKRFTFLRRPHNFGMGLNIWASFVAATTKYVATLNDDDMWQPSFLVTMISALEANPEATVAFCDMAHIDSNDQVIVGLSADADARDYGRLRLTEGLHQPFIYQGVWQRAIPAAVSAVFRRSAIDWGNFPDGVAGYYDEWLAYLAVREGGAVWYTSARLSHYRVHQSSETAANHMSPAARLRHRSQEEFITRAKLADQAVAQCHPNLLRRNRRALFGLVIAAILNQNQQIARSRIAASSHLHPALLIALLRAMTFMPQWLAGLILGIKMSASGQSSTSSA